MQWESLADVVDGKDRFLPIPALQACSSKEKVDMISAGQKQTLHFGHRTLTGMLLAHGAAPLIPDRVGRTALDEAKARGGDCLALIEAELKRRTEGGQEP
jgi:hypothetical protein